MSESLSEDGVNQEDSQEEEDVMTPAELISKLEEAWLNEKFSPELQENKSEVVECVMEQLTHMTNEVLWMKDEISQPKENIQMT